jgi:hypothetical protein
MLGKRASPVRREAVRKGPSWYLAGGPPYRTAGSASGTGKRARSNPGTAPRADSANPAGEPARALRQQFPVVAIEVSASPDYPWLTVHHAGMKPAAEAITA